MRLTTQYVDLGEDRTFCYCLENVYNLNSCDDMDNACNVGINMSLNGVHKINYEVWLSCSNIQISKKVGLVEMKGRVNALSSQQKITTIVSFTRYGTCAKKIYKNVWQIIDL